MCVVAASTDYVEKLRALAAMSRYTASAKHAPSRRQPPPTRRVGASQRARTNAKPTSGRGNIGISKKHASDSKSKSRTRLNFGQKIEILGLLRKKVTYGEIARRFKCGATAIGNIAKERVALEENHALGGNDFASKSTRGGAFPKVCFSSTAAQQLEEQEEFAAALLQDSQAGRVYGEG